MSHDLERFCAIQSAVAKAPTTVICGLVFWALMPWCSGLSYLGLELLAAAAGPQNTLATAGSEDSHCPACMGWIAVLPPRQPQLCKHIDMPVMLYLAHHRMRRAGWPGILHNP